MVPTIRDRSLDQPSNDSYLLIDSASVVASEGVDSALKFIRKGIGHGASKVRAHDKVGLGLFDRATMHGRPLLRRQGMNNRVVRGKVLLPEVSDVSPPCQRCARRWRSPLRCTILNPAACMAGWLKSSCEMDVPMSRAACRASTGLGNGCQLLAAERPKGPRIRVSCCLLHDDDASKVFDRLNAIPTLLLSNSFSILRSCLPKVLRE